MSRNRNRYVITPEIAAAQLDLLLRVYGIEEVERYFNQLDDVSLDYPVYVALLQCYVTEKSVAKAEATMERIRKFNSSSTLPYNQMLGLYTLKRDYLKLEELVREMLDKGIAYNRITYETLLTVYSRSDVEKMERLLVKMESDDWDYVNFKSYGLAVKGYLKSGAVEKAYALLRRAESLIGVNGRYSVYLSLITYYATLQKKEDVYRVWDLLPEFAELSKSYYVTMISSLVKLDDLDGARKIVEEWEGTSAAFDVEVTNLIIRAYCKKGDVGNAEAILKRLMDAGKELNAQTFSHMALGYLKNEKMEKAVEFTLKAFLASVPSWKPNLIVVTACLEYMQKRGDTDGMQEMLMLLGKYGRSSNDVKEIIERFSSYGKKAWRSLNF